MDDHQPDNPHDDMDDFVEGDHSEDAEAPDEDAEAADQDAEAPDEGVGGKKRRVQKMATRGLVEAAQIKATSHQFPGNSMSVSIIPIPMISLTETVLFFWDFFDTSSSAKGNFAGIGRVKDWADKANTIRTTKLSTSRVNTASHSRVVSLSNASRSLKGTTQSTSSATQPPPTPVSFLDEDIEPVEFGHYAQERAETGGTGVCYSYSQCEVAKSKK